MPLRQQIQKASEQLDAPGLLRYLITEKFPGDIVLALYKCWIRAVYHASPVSPIVQRVDSDGQIIKI